MQSGWTFVAGIVVAACAASITRFLIRVSSNHGAASSQPDHLRCPAPLTLVDILPLVSWVSTGARCRICGGRAWILPMIDLVSTLLVMLVIGVLGWSTLAVAWLSVIPIALALAWIDFRELRLPNRLNLALFVLTSILLSFDAAMTGTLERLATALVSALALGLFYGGLHLVSRGAIGMGDVKLAFPIGVLTGYSGWQVTLTATFATFFVGGLIAAVLLAAGKAGAKTSLPWGPFMLFGAFASVGGVVPWFGG